MFLFAFKYFGVSCRFTSCYFRIAGGCLVVLYVFDGSCTAGVLVVKLF